MPAAKFNWLRTKYFGIYSKVAAGSHVSKGDGSFVITQNRLCYSIG